MDVKRLCAVVCLFLSSIVLSQESYPVEGQPQNEEDALAESVCTYDCGCGETIVLSNGDATVVRTDLAVPGRGAIHFALTRVYHSRQHFTSVLGPGWNLTYYEGLQVQGNGDLVRCKRARARAHVGQERQRLHLSGGFLRHHDPGRDHGRVHLPRCPRFQADLRQHRGVAAP